MANVYLQDSTLTSIGNAIREKTGETGLLLPSQMPAAIQSIETGGSGGGSILFNEIEGDTVKTARGSTDRSYGAFNIISMGFTGVEDFMEKCIWLRVKTSESSSGSQTYYFNADVLVSPVFGSFTDNNKMYVFAVKITANQGYSIIPASLGLVGISSVPELAFCPYEGIFYNITCSATSQRITAVTIGDIYDSFGTKQTMNYKRYV